MTKHENTPTEQKIEDFAEDLGRMLGSARAKAEGWLGQRQAIAKHLGLSGDPFLIAVAVGASCDFLSPIGHQCNTLVMGPGGYRFGDYWHLGLPLSLLVVIFGAPLILAVWPLR